MINKGLEGYNQLVKEAKKVGGPKKLRETYCKKGYNMRKSQESIFSQLIDLCANIKK